jgi:hypothetical protein
VSQNILRNISAQTAANQQTDTLLALDAQARARDDAIRNRLNANALAHAIIRKHIRLGRAA